MSEARIRSGFASIYGFWSDDGLRLVQRGLAIDPALRLDPDTLMAITFAYRGATLAPARRLIDAHAGPDARRVVLAAAIVIRDPQIRHNLVADAERRGAGPDVLDQRLFAAAWARSCDEQRRTLRDLGAPTLPILRLMLALLEANPCLHGDARQLLAGAP